MHPVGQTRSVKGKYTTHYRRKFGYDLNFSCDGIRDSYRWGGLCQNTVPQAIIAFLEGEDFEDCIRNAISLGGDSDTLACITGSIAEARYGIPHQIREKAMEYLPQHFRNVVAEFEARFGPEDAQRTSGKEK